MLLAVIQRDVNVPSRAEIHEENEGIYRIEFYDPNGSMAKSEIYINQKVGDVYAIAENWMTNVSLLNG